MNKKEQFLRMTYENIRHLKKKLPCNSTRKLTIILQYKYKLELRNSLPHNTRNYVATNTTSKNKHPLTMVFSL